MEEIKKRICDQCQHEHEKEAVCTSGDCTCSQ